MKQQITSQLRGISLAAALLALMSIPSRAQTVFNGQTTLFSERNLSGPRLGVTWVPGNNALTNQLHDRNIGPMISQFGWHFEYQVVPEGGGPSFVIQFVPLAGGVEYGTLIPSATLAMGVRFPEGFEFGLGPNVLLYERGAKSALVMSVGKSFNYGGVSIPINLAFATNPDGSRISFIFGYAIAKDAK